MYICHESKHKGMKKRFLLSMLLLIASFAYCHGGNPYTTLYINTIDMKMMMMSKVAIAQNGKASRENEYGKYGSKYNSNSIWNEYGKYGSDYSNYSPFNEYASKPPVLKDKNGKIFGYFTANRYKYKRADYDIIDTILENYEEIRDDVGDWYDVIF